MKISERLKQLRYEQNMSQEALASKIGITRTAYSNYEQGIREPSIDLIIAFCDFFNVTADYLIGRTDNY